MPSSRTPTGLPPGVNIGQTGPRLLAALVEVGPVWLLTAVAVLVGLVLDGPLAVAIIAAVLALAWAVFVWFQRATKAAGIGMRLDSLQIVGFSDGRALGWGRVLIRALVFAGLTVSVVGLIAMLVVMSRHPRRQGWHDLAANAVVIKERPLAPPRPKAAVSRSSAPARSGTPSSGQQRPKSGSVPAAASPRTAAQGGPAGATSAAKGQAGKGQAGKGQAGKGSAGKSAARKGPAGNGSARPGSAGKTTAGSPAGSGAVTAGAAGATTGTSATDTAPPSTPDDAAATDVAAAAEAAEDRVVAEWLLRLDDGRDVDVAGLVLLGRNPQPRVGEEDATLIKVSDDTRTVSKSHLAVGVDANGLYVMDRGSTNGTVVTAPDGGQRPCPPGDLIDVPAGSVISFGDHWLEVRRPAALAEH